MSRSKKISSSSREKFRKTFTSGFAQNSPATNDLANCSKILPSASKDVNEPDL
jgi:hypothetical protein